MTTIIHADKTPTDVRIAVATLTAALTKQIPKPATASAASQAASVLGELVAALNRVWA